MPRDGIVPGCAGRLTSLISHVAVDWLNRSPHTLIGAACAPSFYGCWCMSVLVHISLYCFEATVVDVAFYYYYSVHCAAGRPCHAGESACCCLGGHNPTKMQGWLSCCCTLCAGVRWLLQRLGVSREYCATHYVAWIAWPCRYHWVHVWQLGMHTAHQHVARSPCCCSCRPWGWLNSATTSALP